MSDKDADINKHQTLRCLIFFFFFFVPNIKKSCGCASVATRTQNTDRQRMSGTIVEIDLTRNRDDWKLLLGPTIPTDPLDIECLLYVLRDNKKNIMTLLIAETAGADSIGGGGTKSNSRSDGAAAVNSSA